MLTSTVAFVVAVALFTVTPGPDSVLVLRAAVSAGWSGALRAASGILVGVLGWGVLTAIGLSALVAASPTAYDVLRLAGAGYLIWLGVQAWRGGRGEEPALPRYWFRTGLITNLLNPKVAAFYLSFLPQFVPAGAPLLPAVLLLAALHALFGLLWFLTIAAAADRARGLLTRRRVVLERVTGTFLVAFGVRLAAARS